MSRHIDFEGIENFRDFGGYDTACGRGLKRGRLYRSGYHAHATDADLAVLGGMGITAVIDLRRPDERSREPSRRWPGFAAPVIENDIHSDHLDWTHLMRGVDELTPQWFYEDAIRYYRRAPFEPRHLDLFARYFQALADSDGPIVVHCAAGKDRTGLVCALTHHIAGVHRDDMMADFILTNDEARMARKVGFLGPWIEKQVGLRASGEALRAAVSVHPDYLDTGFAAIEAEHGSIDDYLTKVLGVDASLSAQIHDRLLG
jgi:protein tyrosine/serine phosphatase